MHASEGRQWGLPALDGVVVELHVALCLGGDVDVVRRIRTSVREALEAGELPADVVGDVALASHELLANAVVHGAPPYGLALHCTPGEVRVAVHDEGDRFPWPPGPHPDPPADCHGLALIRSMGGRLACHGAGTTGKTVSATFRF